MAGSARLRKAIAVAGPPVAAAVLGNAFIGRDSMRWFRGLRAPRMQVPVAALTPYTAWVIGYDVPWTYRLWQLNRD